MHDGLGRKDAWKHDQFSFSYTTSCGADDGVAAGRCECDSERKPTRKIIRNLSRLPFVATDADYGPERHFHRYAETQEKEEGHYDG
jgi:hypothetical protein